MSRNINSMVDLFLQEKDFATFNFLQWYVAEQHEEELLFRKIIDKIHLIGDNENSPFWADKEVG